MSAAIRGDATAIASLWNEHRRWIAAVLLTYKPRFEDLEDLLQEVAVTLVSKIDTLRDETNIRAWLRVIAVNAARAAARSGRTRRVMQFQNHDGFDGEAFAEPAQRGRSASADTRIELAEETKQMIELVADLPDSYREPLMLRAVKGMRSKEIAEILDVPPATVDTRIARARRMLQARMEPATSSLPYRGTQS